MKTETLDIRKITADENQPRKLFAPEKLKTLKDSIKKYGVMNPLIVEEIDGEFVLVDGERRFRASKEVGLKEVPVIVVAPRSRADKLIQQFHLQEQHEGWSPTEKAMALYDIAQELNIPLRDLCAIVGLSETTARRYIAFAEIIDKKAYTRSDTSLDWAADFKLLKNAIKKIYHDELEEEYDTAVEKEIEHVLINQIKNGGVKNAHDIAKLKDSFKKSPTLIKEFLENPDATAEKLFIKSKAKGAYFLRNFVYNCSRGAASANEYLRIGDVTPSAQDIMHLKRCRKVITETLDRLGESYED